MYPASTLSLVPVRSGGNVLQPMCHTPIGTTQVIATQGRPSETNRSLKTPLVDASWVGLLETLPRLVDCFIAGPKKFSLCLNSKGLREKREDGNPKKQ